MHIFLVSLASKGLRDQKLHSSYDSSGKASAIYIMIRMVEAFPLLRIFMPCEAGECG